MWRGVCLFTRPDASCCKWEQRLDASLHWVGQKSSDVLMPAGDFLVVISHRQGLGDRRYARWWFVVVNCSSQDPGGLLKKLAAVRLWECGGSPEQHSPLSGDERGAGLFAPQRGR